MGSKRLIDFLLEKEEEQEEKKKSKREKFNEIKKLSETNPKIKELYDLLRSLPHKIMLGVISPAHQASIQNYRLDGAISMIKQIKTRPSLDNTKSAEAYNLSGIGFSGEYETDLESLKELRKQQLEAEQLEAQTEKELGEKQKELADVYKRLMSGLDIKQNEVRDISRVLEELSSKQLNTKIKVRDVQAALTNIEELFIKKHGDVHANKMAKEEEVTGEKSRRLEREIERPKERRQETGEIFAEKERKKKRSEQIKNMKLYHAPIDRSIEIAREVAKEGLPNPEVFEEIINKQRILIKAERHMDSVYGTTKYGEEVKWLYNEVMIKYILMIRDIKDNYPKPEEMIDIEKARNTLDFLEEEFEDRFVERIEGYKKGYLLRRLNSEWADRKRFVIDEKGRRKRVILKKQKGTPPHTPRKVVVDPDKGIGSSNVGGKLPRKLISGRPKRRIVKVRPKPGHGTPKPKTDDEDE